MWLRQPRLQGRPEGARRHALRHRQAVRQRRVQRLHGRDRLHDQQRSVPQRRHRLRPGRVHEQHREEPGLELRYRSGVQRRRNLHPVRERRLVRHQPRQPLQEGRDRVRHRGAAMSRRRRRARRDVLRHRQDLQDAARAWPAWPGPSAAATRAALCKLGVVACASASSGLHRRRQRRRRNGLWLEHGVQRQRAVRDVRGGQGLHDESRRSLQDRRHRLHDGCAAAASTPAIRRPERPAERTWCATAPAPACPVRRDGLHHQPVDLPHRATSCVTGRRLHRRRAQAVDGDLHRRPDVRRQRFLRRLRRRSDLHGQSQRVQAGHDDLLAATTTCIDGANTARRHQLRRGHGLHRRRHVRRVQPPDSRAQATRPLQERPASCATGAMTCADDANKPGGTSCGTDMVCDGNGACVACTANATCATNPTPCKTGIVSCMSGAPVCLDFGNRSAGTACGADMVCDGTGTCIACAAGHVVHRQPRPLLHRLRAVRDRGPDLRRRTPEGSRDRLRHQPGLQRKRAVHVVHGRPGLHDQPPCGVRERHHFVHDRRADLQRRYQQGARNRLRHQHGLQRRRNLRRVHRRRRDAPATRRRARPA